MVELVWIIDKKRKAVYNNPFKLVNKGLLQSTCGHANKSVDNDLIFKSKADAENYLNVIIENSNLFQNQDFGTKRIRHLYITHKNKDVVDITYDIYAKVSLSEDPSYPIGSYNQYVTLTFDNYNQYSNLILNNHDQTKNSINVGSILSLSFFHKKQKEIIDNLKVIKIDRQCIKLLRKVKI